MNRPATLKQHLSKVFASYNHTGREWAEWMAGVPGRAGYETIIQAWDFRPGENFVAHMMGRHR